jgi:hypothetical protein
MERVGRTARAGRYNVLQLGSGVIKHAMLT